MNVFQFFGTSEDLEEKGVWHDLGEGARVLVARNGNKNHAEELKKLMAPYRRQMQMNKLPDEVYKEISIKAMARSILVDWEGLKDINGKELKYSYENALNLLTQLNDFRNVITAFSEEMEAYQVKSEEAAIKN